MKAKTDKKTMFSRISSENFTYYAILFPFMGLFFLFTILPVLTSIVLSFFDFDMISRPIFNNFANYARMFSGDDLFWKILGNTLKFSIVTGPLGFIIAFVLAWMINEFSQKVRVILTFLFYIPALVGNALLIWQILFSSDRYGYLNNFLLSFGLITEPINWLQNDDYVMPIMIIIQLWMSMGVSFLANIAGLQNVNVELYESAAIDGIRTRWHELWYITLPAMKPQLMFGAVMTISSSFAGGAICDTLCGFPSTDYAAHTIMSHLNDYGTIRFEMGYACAIAVLLFLLMIGTNKLVNILMRKVGE